MVFRLLRAVGPGVVILRNKYARRFLWAEARYQVSGAWRGVKRKADTVYLHQLRCMTLGWGPETRQYVHALVFFYVFGRNVVDDTDTFLFLPTW